MTGAAVWWSGVEGEGDGNKLLKENGKKLKEMIFLFLIKKKNYGKNMTIQGETIHLS